MNKISKKILCLIIGLALVGCTISHTYGPYRGKVVDVETGAPIEGAVVFVKFNTEGGLSPGGAVSRFVDAVEALTDANGEFEIPAQKVNAFRMFHNWDPYESVIIFKPGYGAYPRHHGIERDLPEDDHFLPKDKYVTIKLPKLNTMEERKENLGNIPYINAPPEKYKLLKKLERYETDLVYKKTT